MTRLRPPVLAQVNFQRHKTELERLAMGDRFREIYRRNLWGSPESASGVGSTIDATGAIRQGLRSVCAEYGISSMLDAPCGDFGWMSALKLGLRTYLGVDIVPELIEENRRRFGSENIQFMTADLTRDEVPCFDLILCRDCLVHLSFDNVFKVLRNFQKSRSTYLLTTTFPEHGENTDIVDGDWRLLNFQREPFGFPEPLAEINEQCKEMGGAYSDKALALWRLRDLPEQ